VPLEILLRKQGDGHLAQPQEQHPRVAALAVGDVLLDPEDDSRPGADFTNQFRTKFTDRA
jgi:hypothetical protein